MQETLTFMVLFQTLNNLNAINSISSSVMYESDNSGIKISDILIVYLL